MNMIGVSFRKPFAVTLTFLCSIALVFGTTSSPSTSSQFLVKNYQTQAAPDNTKWIQVSQLDAILLAIEEKLRDLSDRQNPDVLTHLPSDIQIISNRLQNVEDQIARTESFNKMRLEQLIESSMKEEFLIDQLTRRIEKNQLQINNQLTELDASLEKVFKAQENLEKGIRKLSTMQNTLLTTVEELAQNAIEIKKDTKNTMSFVNTTQKTFEVQFMQVIQNITLQRNNTSTNTITPNGILKYDDNETPQLDSQSKSRIMNEIQKQLREESSKLISSIDVKYKDLKSQTQSVDTSTKECLSLINKIHTRMDHEQQEMGDYLDNFLESLTHDLKNHHENSLLDLESKLKPNFDAVLAEQQTFTNNCRRLQLNEEQMEDKIVAILQKLFNYIDNRTDSMRLNVENLINYEQVHNVIHARQLEALAKSTKEESSQIGGLTEHSLFKILNIEGNITQLQSSVIMLSEMISSVDMNIQDIKKHLKIPINDSQFILKTVDTGSHSETEVSVQNATNLPQMSSKPIRGANMVKINKDRLNTPLPLLPPKTRSKDMIPTVTEKFTVKKAQFASGHDRLCEEQAANGDNIC